MINPSAMQEAVDKLDDVMEELAEALTTDEWLEFIEVFDAIKRVAVRHKLSQYRHSNFTINEEFAEMHRRRRELH